MSKMMVFGSVLILAALYFAPVVAYPLLPVSAVGFLESASGSGLRVMLLSFFVGVLVTAAVGGPPRPVDAVKVEKKQLRLKRDVQQQDPGLQRLRALLVPGAAPPPEVKPEPEPVPPSEPDWRSIALDLLKEKENGAKAPEGSK